MLSVESSLFFSGRNNKLLGIRRIHSATSKRQSLGIWDEVFHVPPPLVYLEKRFHRIPEGEG